MQASRNAAILVKASSSSTSHTPSTPLINKFTHESTPKFKHNSHGNSHYCSHSRGKKSNSFKRSKSFETSNRSRSNPSENYQESKLNPCDSCGGLHLRKNCRFRNATCNSCRTSGHISRVCRKKSTAKNSVNTFYAVYDFPDSMSETEFLQHNSINRIGHSPSKKDKIPPIMLDVSLNGKTIPMELDTGGGFSIVSLDLMQKFFPNVKIHRVQEPLISYSKTKFNKIGEAYFSVTFGKRTLQLPLGIVDIPGESIFGRDWIFWYRDLLSISELFEPDQIFTSNSNTIHNVQPDSSLSKILDKFPNFFHENAGLMKGPPVDFHFKSDCEPVFAKARLLPYTLLDLYSQEIDRKLKLGFYEQVQASEWASPTHVVYKNGKLRITGDYKATLNPCLIADEYPIPKIQEILHKLRGAKYFCKLDITDAFMSLPCTQKASEAMTLNTPTHGLIRPTRAQYGVCSIPAIWQRRLQAALSHLKNAINFFDDVLVFADSIEDLLIALEETLQAIADAGLKLNRPKSKFFLTSVDFVGYQIDATGLHKLNKHILPIINAPKPNTAAQLRTFLGK
nr:PREDICTED: uncharacterized protein K02A2.6-like [Bemisia tabaci]